MENQPENTLATTQKVKNLFATIILLTGLLVGSIFIDFAQLLTGKGFSPYAIKTHNVLETADKTWVAYTDPKVSVQVIADADCPQCNPNEALLWLRRVLPTLEASKIEGSDPIAQALVERFQIKTLPAFIFSESVAYTDFYSQASSLFTGEGKQYFLDMTQIGLPIGKYLQFPEIGETDIARGPKDAKVKIVEFSDFQCSFCKLFHEGLMNVLKNYDGQVLYVYKQLPLPSHAQAENAALASLCANAQGKFQTYADTLFARQDDWGKSSGTQKFKNYAWMLKLSGTTFSKCLDSKQYQDKVSSDKDEAISFLIDATPATFINSTFVSGAISENDLKSVIDKELAK